VLTHEQLLHVGTAAQPCSYNDLQLLHTCRFLGNMVVNSLTSTGAFEVFYDGHQVCGTHTWHATDA
jgi:hypothetical protein